MTMVFDQIVDTVKELPFEQQTMLRDLIDKWQIEMRRREIAQDAQASLQLLRDGQLQPQSAQAVIAELEQSLGQTE